jgi:hypothetical protein
MLAPPPLEDNAGLGKRGARLEFAFSAGARIPASPTQHFLPETGRQAQLPAAENKGKSFS